ncbi:RNA polymerase sigma factor [Streptomyces mashuensis]|uniref:RNA polymerase sigma factor n=1 Tax=Streptomyces mashuensis TaxID=33904 RepID=A0A919EEL5_9ACTN|nr:sigma-70 family RNA polymerase sigma factor [Streptomyces mashuensis]GHF58726.1 RNA polymerase sigma factor [Streptomyces mashuensis]
MSDHVILRQAGARAAGPAGSATRSQFAEFYAENYPLIVRFLMRQGLDAHEAADAAQAAFVEAFRCWGLIERPRAWLRTVSHRMHLKQVACHHDLSTGVLPERPSTSTGPLGQVVLKEEEQRVLAALAALSERQRLVMAWRLDGFSHEEIARELGMTAAAVRQAYVRARTALKARLLGEAS